MDIDLKLNGTSYKLREGFDFKKLSASGFTKGSFLARKAGGAETGAMVYLAKDCKISCVGGKVQWAPNVRYDGGVDQTWNTCAYLVFKNAVLTRAVVQQLGNEAQAKIALESFVERCAKVKRWKLVPDEATGVHRYEDTESSLSCQTNRTGEHAYVAWEVKEPEA